MEKLFKLADSLETKYYKAIERVEKIEQSVLAKAFRGELAPQDPNDEPAEELLKRILAEKSKLESAKEKIQTYQGAIAEMEELNTILKSMGFKDGVIPGESWKVNFEGIHGGICIHPINGICLSYYYVGKRTAIEDTIFIPR